MMNKKTFLSTLGVIVLGALGSALWEFGKPLLASFVNVVAELSTLGFESLENDFYLRAARTLGRPIGLALSTSLVVGFISLVGTVLCSILSFSEERSVSRFSKTMSRVFLFACIVFMLQAIHISYSMKFATHYELLEVQASPYMSDLEQKKVRAMFSRISSKEDYAEVIDFLAAKIRSAGEVVPEPR